MLNYSLNRLIIAKWVIFFISLPIIRSTINYIVYFYIYFNYYFCKQLPRNEHRFFVTVAEFKRCTFWITYKGVQDSQKYAL